MKRFCFLLLFLAGISLPTTALQAYEVLGLGAACVDLFIFVDDEFLQENVPGLKGGAFRLENHIFEDILQKGRKGPLKRVVGGSVSNTLRGLSCMGHSCALFSHVGSDESGEFLIDSLKNYGIQGILKVCPDLPTTKVLCMVTPEGERTMRASQEPFFDTDLDPSLFEIPRLMHVEGRRFLFCGYVEKAFRLAKEAGVTVSMDLSSFETIQKCREVFHRVLTQYVDLVFANEDEVKELTGYTGEKAALALNHMGPTAIVTMGGQGCWIAHAGKTHFVATKPIKPLDTTGAGDLFASGFLAGYLEGRSWTTCAKMGHLLGGAVIQATGAEIPKDKWPSLLKKLREIKEMD